jgi:hypothetical protein
MSFISESSIETAIKPPSLAYPSLQRQRSQSAATADPLLLQQKTCIHFASRLIKLRSELRSPSYATRSSSLYYPPAAAAAAAAATTTTTNTTTSSSTPSLSRSQSLSIPFSSSSPSSCYHNDDESDIVSQADQGSQLTYLSQLLRATQQHQFYATSQNQLALPSRMSLTSELNKKAQQQQQQPQEEDHASMLCNSDSDSELEEDTRSVTTIHSFNRRIIQKRLKKPKAFLVKISPSSAAAASVARLRRVNKKRSCSSAP